VRHLDDRAARRQRRDRVLHLASAERVQVRGRLVQQQQRRIAQERPGHRDLLPLARRQPQPALADPGLVAVLQVADERIGPGQPGGLADVRRAGTGSAERDVAGHRVVEQMRALRHPGHLLPPVTGADLGQPDRSQACPATAIVPAVGSVNRSSRLSSDDFPAPLGPVTTTCSRGRISRVSPSSAGRSRPE